VFERISEKMDLNYHQMQHFITESTWDFRQLLDQTARPDGECRFWEFEQWRFFLDG